MTIDCYVDTDTGVDDTASRGSSGSPFATLAYAQGSVGGMRSSNNHTGVNYADLVTATETLIFHCAGAAAETGKVYISGYTTSATYGITVIGDWPGGPWSTSYYRIEIPDDAGTYRQSLSMGQQHVDVENLQLKNTYSATPTTLAAALSLPANSTAKNCIAQLNYTQAAADASYLTGFYCSSGDDTTRFINCIAYESGSKQRAMLFHGRMRAYNCLAADGNFGYHPNGGYQTNWMFNCVAYGCVSPSHNAGQYDTATPECDYNCNDTPADSYWNMPGTNTYINQAISATNFVDATNGDFTPTAADTILSQAGYDLTGINDYDQLGNARSSWTLGPIQAAASGPATHQNLPLLGVG